MDKLPTASDYFNARFDRDKNIYRLGEQVYNDLLRLAEEAELHRIDYDQKSRDAPGAEIFGYWKGRRDEAEHFRDRLIALIESLGK